MLDLAHETYQALKLNKLRTALTGFSVAWGIFILIVLLGASNGILNASRQNLSDSGDNTITLYPSVTSMPYKGFERGRSIKLYLSDKDNLESNNTDRIAESSTQLGRSDTLRAEGDFVVCNLQGVFPKYFELRHYNVAHGRTLNDADMNDLRKVAVITEEAAKSIFRTPEKAVGKRVNVGGGVYTVIGVISGRWMGNDNSVFVPFSTYKSTYSLQPAQLHTITMYTKDINDFDADTRLRNDVRHQLAEEKQFSPDDNEAVWMRSSIMQRTDNNNMTTVLHIAVWVVGLLTLLSGIVGVSNIMFVSVKERTHEIGIRRAIGAKPRSIYMMIIAESVAVTAIFGYVGLIAGVAVTQAAAHVAEVMQQGNDMVVFLNPTVGLDIAIQVTFAMILAGIVAGLFPARKAMNVNPVESLNYE